MDKLSEHAIRMLEIVDNEHGFYKNMDGDVADIARAVYDLILQVQMLKMADRKTEPQTERCPHCGDGVITKGQTTCPICGKSIEQTDCAWR